MILPILLMSCSDPPADDEPAATVVEATTSADFAKTCYDKLQITAIKPKAGNESTKKWTDGKPYFDCKKGTYLPFGKGTYHDKCELPDWLSGKCYEGTYLQEVEFDTKPGQDGKLQGVLLCRHKSHAPKLPPGTDPAAPVPPAAYDDNEFDDIAIIARNKKTGETCFFQTDDGAPFAMAGTATPAPHMKPEATTFGCTTTATAGSTARAATTTMPSWAAPGCDKDRYREVERGSTSRSTTSPTSRPGSRSATIR